MSGREKALLILAAGVSLLLHAAVGYAVMNLRIDSASSFPLFERTREEPDRPMRVERASEDLIVEDEEAPESPEASSAKGPGQDASAQRSMSDRLLDSLDPQSVLPPEPAPELEPEAPRPKLAGPPEAPQPRAGRSQPMDATEDLLRHAEPSVSLPEFTEASDEVRSAPPDDDAPINPSGSIDPAKLDQLDPLEEGGPAGSGALAAAGGAPGGDGFGGDLPLPMPGGPPGLNPGGGSGDGDGEGQGDGSPDDSEEDGETTGPERPALSAATDPSALDLPELPDGLMNLEPGETEAGDDQEKPVAHLDDDFRYDLRLLPEFQRNQGLLGLFGGGGSDGEEPGYFEVRITPKRSLRRLEPLKKDVVWVVDTSASITNDWVSRVRNGVSMALDGLNEGDRFNIVTFKDTVRLFSEEGMAEATPRQRSRAREFLEGAEASGYTDVSRALSEMLIRHVPDERVYQIVLISDGEPTRGAIDPRQIINIITRENDLVAGIFCVGVGDDPDRELLEYLAYRNKGTVVYPENRFQTAATLRELAGRLQYPVVKNAAFSAAGVNAGWIYPPIPRDIYQGQPVRLFGRYEPGRSRRLSMRLSGVNGAQQMDLTFTLRFDEAERGDEKIARNWALHRLHHLYSRLIDEGENKELKQQIERLQREYGLEPIN